MWRLRVSWLGEASQSGEFHPHRFTVNWWFAKKLVHTGCFELSWVVWELKAWLVCRSKHVTALSSQTKSFEHSKNPLSAQRDFWRVFGVVLVSLSIFQVSRYTCWSNFIIGIAEHLHGFKLGCLHRCKWGINIMDLFFWLPRVSNGYNTGTLYANVVHPQFSRILLLFSFFGN